MNRIKSIFLPLILISLPLWFFDHLARYLGSIPKLVSPEGASDYLYFTLFQSAYFRDFLTIALFTLFVVLMKRRLNLTAIKDSKILFTVVGCALGVATLPKIIGYLLVGPAGDLMLVGIPGVRMLPILAFYYFGIIDTFKDSYSELKLLLFILLADLGLELLGSVSFAPLYTFFPIENFVGEIPLISFNGIRWNIFFLLPPLYAFISSIVYHRLGLFAAILFSFLTVSFALVWELGFGLSYPTQWQYLIIYSGLIYGVYRFLPKHGSKFL